MTKMKRETQQLGKSTKLRRQCASRHRPSCWVQHSLTPPSTTAEETVLSASSHPAGWRFHSQLTGLNVKHNGYFVSTLVIISFFHKGRSGSIPNSIRNVELNNGCMATHGEGLNPLSIWEAVYRQQCSFTRKISRNDEGRHKIHIIHIQ